MAHDGPHIVPKSILLKVFGALIVLTGLTVGVAYVPLGPLTVPVALGIAGLKATLVVLFFMHLKYDNPVNALTFTIGTIFVVVFVTITLLDTAFRGDLGNVTAQTVQEIQAEQERAQQRQDAIPSDSLRIAPSDYPNQDRGASMESDEGS
ncbi:cytochrome C oxidase subunit IV family protein [Salinibacter altiplanensis]|uniref:cytochrome C oxidase subunit IV family protein n=1 Tax=Salinibacter altiplanensis TaxID=1803181 RepID=UPI000C9F2F4D|nr:cytochrome C oxidase subunit IV family protein [Salinibacter altiplanensis]